MQCAKQNYYTLGISFKVRVSTPFAHLKDVSFQSILIHIVSLSLGLDHQDLGPMSDDQVRNLPRVAWLQLQDRISTLPSW